MRVKAEERENHVEDEAQAETSLDADSKGVLHVRLAQRQTAWNGSYILLRQPSQLLHTPQRFVHLLRLLLRCCVLVAERCVPSLSLDSGL